ncbi:MAG: hypothetical protein J6X42_04265 [Alphaproteobacteria bacterium]|nr:hypothetical protein [Alphaproteobacteria bacterium]
MTYMKWLASFAFVLALSACSHQPEEWSPEPRASDNAEFDLPLGKSAIRTPDGANALDLETPLRCNVNWRTQQLILTLPFNNTDFKLQSVTHSDELPRLEVTGFTFETMSAEKALVQLTKEAGITLVAKDAPYAPVSGEDLKGELTDVVNMITNAAGIFYTYDADKKVMTLSKRSEQIVYVPKTRPIILGLLDVLRGAGLTDMTTDWVDYSITFNADVELRNKTKQLINYFEENPTLIAYDINVFKITPYDGCDIEWKRLLDAFNFGSITTAQTGVIGRVLTTTNDINLQTLRRFLGEKASIEAVSEGKFVVPDLWTSRFDVGKCGAMSDPKSELSVLAKAFVHGNNRITSQITLETTSGQITNFKVNSRLGENFMIIGLPHEIFSPYGAKSEIVIFMVPRLIKTVKTNENIKNNL